MTENDVPEQGTNCGFGTWEISPFPQRQGWKWNLHLQFTCFSGGPLTSRNTPSVGALFYRPQPQHSPLHSLTAYHPHDKGPQHDTSSLVRGATANRRYGAQLSPSACIARGETSNKMFVIKMCRHFLGGKPYARAERVNAVTMGNCGL